MKPSLRAALATVVLSCALVPEVRAADLIVLPTAPPAVLPTVLGGLHTYDTVHVQSGGQIVVPPYDGTPNTGYLVLRANSIVVDSGGSISAKGAGYRALLCDNGEGPPSAPTAGGRGGCGVRDSAGGGAHVGAGGQGTKDCFTFPACAFPQSYEENCVGTVIAGPSCQSTLDCRNDDGLPPVGGEAFVASIYDTGFGAAGGDKGCRDGFDTGLRGGNGGGRIVLVAVNDMQTGTLEVHGNVDASGNRGCASGNDSAGGGAGGSVILVGDQVTVGDSARVTAAGGRGGDSQPKCTTCTMHAQCQSGQTCSSGRCSPCNCVVCSTNADCDAGLGQTCKNLGGSLGNVCADASNQCTPASVFYREDECAGTQSAGTCDDCGGGGGGGYVRVQSRNAATIGAPATVEAGGAPGGNCAWCRLQTSATGGDVVVNDVYAGEVCDGEDNDFNGTIDDLPPLDCNGTPTPACVGGVPQACAQADVSVTKTLTTAPPYFHGQSVTFEIVVANAGPETATNVQVSDTPTNLTITGVSGACAALPCTIPALAAAADATITVTAVIPAAGAFANAASVAIVEVDPNSGNDTAADGGTAATLAGGCPPAPTGGCRDAGKHGVTLKRPADATKRAFQWKWQKGLAASAAADFGDPLNPASSYSLCVYDQTAGVPTLAFGAAIAGGGMCGTKPCWKAVGDTGFAYKGPKGGNPDGLASLAFKGGVVLKPSLQVKGKGAGLGLAAPVSGSAYFDQDPAVLVQLLRNGSATCWSSGFAPSGTKKNVVDQFKAVAP